MGNLWKNARTVLRRPRYLFEYAGYQLNRIRHGKHGALVRLPWGHEIGGFVNFSEYLSAPAALSEAEVAYLRSIASDVNRSGRRAVIIDVGANIGVTTLLFASIYSKSLISCFEPSVSTFKVLIENLNRNAIDGVAAMNMAVSSSTGEVQFDMSAGGRANFKITKAQGKEVSAVAATTLDDYCNEKGIREIDLLKVDTEGFEQEVFKGAAELLSRAGILRVYFEFCPILETASGAQVGDAVRYLEEHGFKIFKITESAGLEPFMLSSSPLPTLCNLVGLRT